MKLINIKSLNDLNVHIQHLVKRRLWLQVIIALILGSSLGVLLNPTMGFISDSVSESIASWLNLPGNIFMKLVQMIMIPLIFASILSGIVNNVSDDLRSFGLSLLGYFVITTVIAIVIGVVSAYLMEPGRYAKQMAGDLQVNPSGSSGGSENVFSDLPETISNLIPANPMQSILSGEMLSIVIFTVIIGVAITQLKADHVRPLMRFAEAMQKICMVIVGWAMRLVPYAVFGLMAALVAQTGFDVFMGLGYYILVVIIGLAVVFVLYLTLTLVLGKMNPFRFLEKVKDALLLAFSTASSAAVMPLSMKVADERLGVSSKVSDFVIPIGATVNMGGTALFQCVTVLFLAQVYGIELAMADLILVTLTVVAASIGTPAIPGGGVIILATVLESTGIPAEGLLIIIGIDRILGMFRSAVNVTGDLSAAVIFDRWFGDESEEAVPIKS